MDIKETLIDQLKKIVQFLNKQKIDYALVGGLAFSALVEPRATMYIDIIIMIKEEHLSGFANLLKDEFESIITHKEPMHFNLMKTWRAINFIDDREMIFDWRQDLADLDKICKIFDDEIDYEYLKYWSDKLDISLYKLPGDIW